MIQFQSLNKSFGRLKVLKNISGQFKPGAVSAIIGHNGSGKTTLMKCLLGLNNSDSGEIIINGTTLKGGPDFKKLIGYMPQIARFPENLTSSELLNMVIELRGQPANRSQEMIDYFGLAQHMNKPVGHLSGGTRQKINASIAFMFDPDILILDEPSAGLDPVSNQLLKKMILEEKAKGKTVIITSHVLSDLEELCDNLLCLFDGDIVFNGGMNSLLYGGGDKTLESALASLIRSSGK